MNMRIALKYAFIKNERQRERRIFRVFGGRIGDMESMKKRAAADAVARRSARRVTALRGLSRRVYYRPSAKELSGLE
jgi:hypothetical protein